VWHIFSHFSGDETDDRRLYKRASEFKSEICNSRARKTRFKCDFLSSIQQIKEMPNVAMQNINSLLFVRSLYGGLYLPPYFFLP